MVSGLLESQVQGQHCGTCRRPVTAVVPEERDIRDILYTSRVGCILEGRPVVLRCDLCAEVEKRLEAYLLVGGGRARDFVRTIFEKTAAAVDGKYPR